MLLQHLQNLLPIQNFHPHYLFDIMPECTLHRLFPEAFYPLCRILLRTHDLIKFSHQLPDLLRICPRRRHFYPEHPHYFSPSCLTGTSVCGIFYLQKKGIALPQAIPLSYIQNYMYFYSFRQDIYLLYRSCKLAMYIILYVQKR